MVANVALNVGLRDEIVWVARWASDHSMVVLRTTLS